MIEMHDIACAKSYSPGTFCASAQNSICKQKGNGTDLKKGVRGSEIDWGVDCSK